MGLPQWAGAAELELRHATTHEDTYECTLVLEGFKVEILAFAYQRQDIGPAWRAHITVTAPGPVPAKWRVADDRAFFASSAEAIDAMAGRLAGELASSAEQLHAKMKVVKQDLRSVETAQYVLPFFDPAQRAQILNAVMGGTDA